MDEQFEAKVANINELYQQTPALLEQGEVVASTGELTVVQVLERKKETWPMRLDYVECQEFEYIRRGL